jgi:hypothetical protein
VANASSPVKKTQWQDTVAVKDERADHEQVVRVCTRLPHQQAVAGPSSPTLPFNRTGSIRSVLRMHAAQAYADETGPIKPSNY